MLERAPQSNTCNDFEITPGGENTTQHPIPFAAISLKQSDGSPSCPKNMSIAPLLLSSARDNMLNRVCRILSEIVEMKQPSTSGSTADAAHLSSTEMWSQWKHLLLKASVLLQTFGRPRRRFSWARMYTTNCFRKSPKLNTTGNQVPFPLERGSGKVPQGKSRGSGPTEGSHGSSNVPTSGVSGEGKQCLVRWERLAPGSVHPETEEVTDTSIVTSVKHVGWTYLQALEDENYCRWIQMTAEHGDPSPELQKLAAYIHINIDMHIQIHIHIHTLMPSRQEVTTPSRAGPNCHSMNSACNGKLPGSHPKNLPGLWPPASTFPQTTRG